MPRATRFRESLLTAARRAWLGLPIPTGQRHRVKALLFRACAPWLAGSPHYRAWREQQRWAKEHGGEALHTIPLPAPRDLPLCLADVPEVSIVIPTYGQLPHTRACLDSLAAHPPRRPVEVIVVDDACPDLSTRDHLAPRGDLRFLRNPSNLGFVGSCNAGAEAARGRWLLFLNNDSLVRPGAVDALVDALEQVPGAGLAGAKLVGSDGCLQEAGGRVWADGRAWNWGRGGHPGAPEFNYLRDVDYCSGAALMLARGLFRAVGGFDLRYAPGYYEDVDLAFAVRQRGLRVLYQPLAEIVHFEGRSAGTVLTAGMKAHEVGHQAVFADKWRAALARQPGLDQIGPPMPGPATVGRVLIVDGATPTPDRDSASVDQVLLMRLLGERGWQVSFLPADGFLHAGPYTRALQGAGVECLYRPFVTSLEALLAERGQDFDLVWLARGPVAARCIAAVRRLAPRARVVFDTVDLHYLRERRRYEVGAPGASADFAASLEALETGLITQVDLTLVRSETEQAELARRLPGTAVERLPLIRTAVGRRGGCAGRNGVVFIGGGRHSPNVDAIRHFHDDILPLVRARLPGVVFHVVGSDLPGEVEALARADVVIHGHVPDLDALLATMRVSVAPLRYGAGLKGKVASSLGSGVPVVASPLAVEGMGFRDGEVVVADNPETFAAEVARLHEDDGYWEALSAAGPAAVEREFGLAVAGAIVERVLARLGLPVGTAGKGAA